MKVRINNTLFRYPLFALLALAVMFTSCDEEDPFTHRVVSPVLLVFEGVTGYLASGGLTSVPSITKTVTIDNYTDPVTLNVFIYELDKSGVLDNTVGIDSIPVSNLAINFLKRDGTIIEAASTDASGMVSVTKSWEELGIVDIEEIVNTAAARTIVIPFSWSGVYKNQAFIRYSQVQFVKPAS